MALRIKEIAKAKGITMQEIAEKIGISPVNLSTSLNGNPTLNRLQEVADILEVDIADFFSRENTEDIHGFLEYKGKVYRIYSMEDFKAFSNVIK
jgi:transcriptional regulator with XRE-family HTH domain